MESGVHDNDHGWQMLVKTLTEISQTYPAVAIGIQGDKGELVAEGHDGMTNVELAVIHEFGTDHGVLARPFIGITIDENESAIKAMLDKIGLGVFSKQETPEGSLLIEGESLKLKILNRVKAGIPPPLDDASLIGRAGDGTPLWDTGELMGSLTSKIVNSNEIDRG